MEFGAARKRGRQDGGAAANGFGVKKSKQEMESFTTGIGSKSKPCTKFFSTSGCQFGDSCHFLHHVPGGIKAVTQMLGTNPAITATARNPVVPPSFPDGSSPAQKSRLCNKYSTTEGCKFGDKCHFAHGEWELGKLAIPSQEGPFSAGPVPNRFGGRMEPTPQNFGAPGSFGAFSTTKISVDASLAGAIIGKGGVSSKHICHLTGAKLAIRDHDSDSNLRNIELRGTLDQIHQASQMVHEIIMNVRSGAGAGSGQPLKTHATSGPAPASNYKTKLCENFAKGTCTFGERCHFAHGAEELRKTGI